MSRLSPESFENPNVSNDARTIRREGKLPYTKLQAPKWALLEKDLDFVIISDVIRRRF